jgi:hypothetical protein
MRNCASEVWSFGVSRNDGAWIASSRAREGLNPSCASNNFARRANQKSLSSPIYKNISVFPNQNQVYRFRRPVSQEGRAHVTNAEQDAVDAGSAV